MSIFSGFDLFPASKGSELDDNAATTDASQNPYLSAAVLSMRSAYDAMYDAVKYVVEGKEASLRQADRMIQKWVEKLEWLVKKYGEMLQRLDDASAGLSASLTLDMAKEAWELIQDFPILRRYLGEANYWLLRDTVGLAAYQASSLGSDASTAVKAAVKTAIKALLATTDGLMSLESYLGAISQYWGALYLKSIPLPLLDSIVPNVTCAYFYKPVAQGVHASNNYPAANSFFPIPLPIPDPEYVVAHAGDLGSLAYDYNDPLTWRDRASGQPKFSNTDAMQRALGYWGSSYTDETIPLVTSASDNIPAIYRRREYDRGKGAEAHPLQVGKTFAQLDTSRSSPAYNSLNEDQAKAYKENAERFKEMWEDEGFQGALIEWQSAWQNLRSTVLGLVQDAFGETPFTSMAQLVDSRAQEYTDAFYTYVSAIWPNGELHPQVLEALQGLRHAWVQVQNHYGRLEREGNLARPDSLTVALFLAWAAAGLRAEASVSSTYAPAAPSWPLLDPQHSWQLFNQDAHPFISHSPFVEWLEGDVPDAGPVEGVEGLHTYSREAPQLREAWVAPMAYAGAEAIGTNPRTEARASYESALLRPVLRFYLPKSYQGFVGGDVIAHTASPESGYSSLGTPDSGALTSPRAWATDSVDSDVAYPRCGLFFHSDVAEEPTTLIGALIGMMSEDSVTTEEVADVVGYSVLKGRQPLTACFGVYGNLIKMASWSFKSMPSRPPAQGAGSTQYFKSKYTRVEPGSDLWYENTNPSHIVYLHSEYYSASQQLVRAVYHGPMAQESYTRGSESYKFYVFPTESISVQEVKPGTAGALRDYVTGPDGRHWAYITMRNMVPKCPKYVEPSKWSVMDILHELYLLASGMSPICGDNGERLRKLEGMLDRLGVSRPQLISQLPDGDGKAAEMEVSLFQDYAEKIKALVDSIYKLREQILAKTEAW